MTDEIILEDGRVWSAASWAVDRVLQEIAKDLSESGGDPVFCGWLRDKSGHCNGLVGFDVRGLTDRHRTEFYEGVRRAVDRLKAEGPTGWREPSAFDNFIKHFSQLLVMKEHIDRGEPPESLNDFQKAIEFDGQILDLAERWD